MNKIRCPWCGKIIDQEKDTVSLRKKMNTLVPRFARFATCSHCYHDYGQMFLFGRLEKIDDQGHFAECNSDLDVTFVIHESYAALRKNEIYFFIDHFDDHPCFSVISPIYIDEIQKKTRMVWASFLYGHHENYEYMTRDCLELFDSDMALVAKIQVRK